MRNGHESWVHAVLGPARRLEPTEAEVARVLAMAACGKSRRSWTRPQWASRGIVLAVGLLLTATAAAAATGLLPLAGLLPDQGLDIGPLHLEDSKRNGASESGPADPLDPGALPLEAVAMVGDEVITKRRFDHWYRYAATRKVGGADLAPPDPPRYARCAAALAHAQPGVAPSHDQLVKQCALNYEQLKQETMRFLIQSRWILLQAEEEGIEADRKEVRRAFEEQRASFAPKDEDYRRFLRSTGASKRDVLFQLKSHLLQRKLATKIQRDAEKVTDADVEAYYEQNKQQVTQPEQRALNVVLTKTKAKADQAKQELEDGAGFEAVSKEYSTDQVSKAQGGKLPAVTRRRLPAVTGGRREKAFDDAVFSAKRGVLVGPVKTLSGWYVFEVTDIVPASSRPLRKVGKTIRAILRQKSQERALRAYVAEFRKRSRRVTVCREEFVVPECGNAPSGTPIPE